MPEEKAMTIAAMLQRFLEMSQRKKSVSLDYSNISDKWVCIVSDSQRVDDEEGTTYYFTGGGIGESLDPVEAMRVGLRLSDEEFRDIQEKVSRQVTIENRIAELEAMLDEACEILAFGKCPEGISNCPIVGKPNALIDDCKKCWNEWLEQQAKEAKKA